MPGKDREMFTQHKLPFFVIIVISLSLILPVTPSLGSSLLFNRDLPIYNPAQPNLNNAAGDNRSNNRLYQDLGTAIPGAYNIPGDDFSIGQAGQTYHIDTVRIWATEALPLTIFPVGPIQPSSSIGNLQMWMGPANGPITSLNSVSSTYAWTPVKYSNGAYYQTVEGGWRQLVQVDVAVNLDVEGGKKYWFFLDGILYSWINKHYYTTNLHASNAALSNATEEGADDIFHWLTLSNGVPTQILDQTSILPSGLGGDGNVQIYGEAVPLPPTVLLLGSGLLGLVGLKRFRKG
jgi:hypothetical protein